MKVLIFGATGGIGKWAVKHALEKGHEVTAFVRFLAPKDTPYTGNVKSGFGDVKMSFNISREDIAAFMVNQLGTTVYLYSMPIIGS